MNEPNQNTSTKTNQKTLTQQVFHPALFNRPRSASLSDMPRPETKQNEVKNSDTVEPTDEVSNQQSPPPWQRVPHTNKRKRTSDSPPNATSVTVSNRFRSLPLDQAEDKNNDPANLKPNKPPPIVLYGIEDLNELSKLIESVCDPKLFKIRIVNKNLLRVLVDCSETYKDVISAIRSKGLIGHTFTPKEKKAYRIVIKKLHYSTPHSEIINAIESSGNKVRGEIINARYGPDKTPSFTFFVNLEPNVNNKAVKDIEYIYHQRVKIEDPRKSTTIVQCQRCQQYGHSKNNCMRPFRCVKCGEGHKTADCPKKDRNTPAKCALCSRDHPANYKGCQVYLEIASRKSNRAKNLVTGPPKNENINASQTQTLGSKTLIKPSYNQPRDKLSYSDITANRYQNNASTESQSNFEQNRIEVILTKQSEKIDQLIQQIGTLLNLLTSVVAKLHS